MTAVKVNNPLTITFEGTLAGYSRTLNFTGPAAFVTSGASGIVNVCVTASGSTGLTGPMGATGPTGPQGQTGWLSDTTNTAAIAAGNTLTFAFTNNDTSNTNFVVESCAVEIG